MPLIQRKTFTLIEMLIVIVIIGILAAALVPRLQAVQGRARDSQRKVDLRTIYTANEVFKTDNGKYPQAGACAYNVNCHAYSSSGTNRLFTLTGILTSVPTDPINTVGSAGFFSGGAYIYTYSNVFFAANNVRGIDTYDMRTLLENRQDPDRCEIKQYPNVSNSACGGIGLSERGKYHYQLSPHSLK